MSKKRLVELGETRLLDERSRAAAPGQFVELAHGFVHYEVAGPEQAQTVVLVTGFSVPYSIWDPTFEALLEASGAQSRSIRPWLH
ncbi:MAG: hypothetical protein R3300_08920 [Candidatus Promineifilaceae bacterium]|nr:hypothetical protein [Candidatus Promineifilaceae bacterium]